MSCVNCNKENSENMTNCPLCESATHENTSIITQKPKFGRKARIITAIVAASLLLLGGTTFAASRIMPRDFALFFLNDATYVRGVFQGITSAATDAFFEALEEVPDAPDTESGTFELALRAEAQRGAVSEIAGGFGMTDPATLNILELLFASSLEIRAAYDMSGSNPAVQLQSAWNVRDNNQSNEVFGLDFLLANNAAFLRSPQLMQNYIGLNLTFMGMDLLDLASTFGGDLLDLDGIFSMPDMVDVDEILTFLRNNESVIREMTADVSEAFFDGFENKSVQRNGTVSVGGTDISLHKAIISTTNLELTTASVSALRIVAENDEYLGLIRNFIRMVDPTFDFSLEELRNDMQDGLDDMLFRSTASSRLEIFEIFIYINRANEIEGFGLNILGPEGIEESFEFVWIENLGFYLISTTQDASAPSFKLYGSFITEAANMNGETQPATRGDVYLRHYSNTRPGDIEAEGRLFSFSYNDNFFSFQIYGRDILELWPALSSELDIFEIRLIENLHMDIFFIASETESEMSLTLTHLDPQISVTFSLASAVGGDINISPPSDADVNYIDLIGLIFSGGDIEAALLNVLDPLELFENVIGIFDNLNDMGFDFSDLLANLLLGMF